MSYFPIYIKINAQNSFRFVTKDVLHQRKPSIFEIEMIIRPTFVTYSTNLKKKNLQDLFSICSLHIDEKYE